MIGLEKDGAGVIVKKEHFRSAKKVLQAGEQIPPHTHPGHDIVFVIVKGKFEMLLDDTEAHLLIPGKVLTFSGDHSLTGTALEDTEIVVTLIKKPK